MEQDRYEDQLARADDATRALEQEETKRQKKTRDMVAQRARALINVRMAMDEAIQAHSMSLKGIDHQGRFEGISALVKSLEGQGQLQT